MEIWKDIDDYNGLYQVSNMGNVKSVERFRTNGKSGYIQQSRILKTGNRNGYLFVGLCKNGVVKTFKVHRLVATHFIPNPENKPEIDHINTDRTDNRVENLRWVTHKENMNNPKSKNKQSISMQDKPSLKGKENQQSKSILQYTKDGKFVKKWDCVMDVERKMGLKHQNICHNALGKSSNCGGFIWRYVS